MSVCAYLAAVRMADNDSTVAPVAAASRPSSAWPAIAPSISPVAQPTDRPSPVAARILFRPPKRSMSDDAAASILTKLPMTLCAAAPVSSLPRKMTWLIAVRSAMVVGRVQHGLRIARRGEHGGVELAQDRDLGGRDVALGKSRPRVDLPVADGIGAEATRTAGGRKFGEPRQQVAELRRTARRRKRRMRFGKPPADREVVVAPRWLARRRLVLVIGLGRRECGLVGDMRDQLADEPCVKSSASFNAAAT